MWGVFMCGGRQDPGAVAGAVLGASLMVVGIMIGVVGVLLGEIRALRNVDYLIKEQWAILFASVAFLVISGWCAFWSLTGVIYPDTNKGLYLVPIYALIVATPIFAIVWTLIVAI